MAAMLSRGNSSRVPRAVSYAQSGEFRSIYPARKTTCGFVTRAYCADTLAPFQPGKRDEIHGPRAASGATSGPWQHIQRSGFQDRSETATSQVAREHIKNQHCPRGVFDVCSLTLVSTACGHCCLICNVPSLLIIGGCGSARARACAARSRGTSKDAIEAVLKPPIV